MALRRKLAPVGRKAGASRVRLNALAFTGTGTVTFSRVNQYRTVPPCTLVASLGSPYEEDFVELKENDTYTLDN